MATNDPRAELDQDFSSEGVSPTEWRAARTSLEAAELYWLSTVRPDGRPHVTPLVAVWHNGALYFCTGPTERKAENLARNSKVILTTGCNTLNEGLDVVVEGDAVQVSDDDSLGRIAEQYLSKYGNDWKFEVRDGAFFHEGGTALVYEVAPSKAFGFAKGEYSQTRWRFSPRDATMSSRSNRGLKGTQ